jgi:cystathionine beta-lyase/cystathionine gamma-synthase
MVKEGVSMAQKVTTLNTIDTELVNEYNDKSIKTQINTKLEFSINILGTNFTDIGEAIVYAYRCGLAAMSSYQTKKSKEGKSVVDQDELYGILKRSHSLEHKADFLREIAKEWFPIDLHTDKKIKTVHLELIELADFLK